MSDVTDERLRNTRAWAWSRIGMMSGAEVIVAACDEALAARKSIRTDNTATLKAAEDQIAALKAKVAKLVAQLRDSCDEARSDPERHANGCPIAAALTARVAKLEAKYHELIFAVDNKYTGETRHETALRYIRRAAAAHSDADNSKRGQ